MFPRIASVILGFLLGAIASIAVYAALTVSPDCTHFQAGVAQPYKRLLTHMRQLDEAGKTEELRRLILQADQRSDAISSFCDGDKGAYLDQVRELTK